MTGPEECTSEDVVGIWQSTDPSAPGFQLSGDGSGRFFTSPGEPLDVGSWDLADCILTLMPTSNTVYLGSGMISQDKTSVDINGTTFLKTN